MARHQVNNTNDTKDGMRKRKSNRDSRLSTAHVEWKLPRSQKLFYALPRGATVGMALLLQTTVRIFYIEGLGMRVEAMAMAIAICKSLDFLFGFIIGYVSDHLKSKFGRRKPFIAFGFPIWLAVMFAINNPKIMGFQVQEKVRMNNTCGNLVQITETQSCPDLQECIVAQEGDGFLPAWNQTWSSGKISYAGANLLVYFTILYFMFFSFGFSTTIIPYDALGMELTDDYDERSSLFGYKSACQFFGYMLVGGSGLFLSNTFPDDIGLQILLSSCLWGLLVLLAFSMLLLFLKTTKPSHETVDSGGDERIVPSVRNLFFNKPYLTYLWMKVPLSIAGLVPVNLLIFYIKLVQQEENSVYETSVVTVIVVITSVISVPFIVKSCELYSKRKTMMYICLIMSCVFTVAFFSPATKVTTYILAVFMGVGAVGTNLIPDAMLADIIDYDELHTGTRSEGTYTVVETNLQQFIEIPSGTLPLIVLSLIGYKNNSGCTCGCGVKCANDFLRWLCPNDIGYACTNGLTASLLFGDPNRTPPCTSQSTEVVWAIKLFGILFPGLCYALAILPVAWGKITADVHQQILVQINRRKGGLDAIDPISGTEIKREDKSERGKMFKSFKMHFSTAERTAVFRKGDVSTLGQSVLYQLIAEIFIFIGVVAFMACIGTEMAITFGALAISLLLVFIPWNITRYLFWREAEASGLARLWFQNKGDASAVPMPMATASPKHPPGSKQQAETNPIHHA